MKNLWVFGSAVQDITVNLDLEQLSREHANLGNQIRLNANLYLKNDLRLSTRMGLREFTLVINLIDPETGNDLKKIKDDFYSLQPGRKYTIKGNIVNKEEIVGKDNFEGDDSAGAKAISVHCESISWGGGGLNTVRFIRSLSPDPQVVPIVYTDIALNEPINEVVEKKWGIIKNHEASNERGNGYSEMLAEFSASRYLEVYLATLFVSHLLYDPGPNKRKARRNWVFSRIRGATQEMTDKIICRPGEADGKKRKQSAAVVKKDRHKEEKRITKIVKIRTAGTNVIFLNSLKNQSLFNTAYEEIKREFKDYEAEVAILAMTESMQQISGELDSDIKRGGRNAPPLILIFNEKEFFNYAEKFDKKLENFMSSADDIPHMLKFAKVAQAILANVPAPCPRIYVTLGSKGSLAIEGFHSYDMVYVGTFTKPKSTVFDTNACGDAYSGTIALLEWAKRNGYRNVGLTDQTTLRPRSYVHEMEYFMGVATAAAYSKATNRFGEVDVNEVKDLLEHSHLASDNLGAVHGLTDSDPQPTCVDRTGRLKTPLNSKLMKITEDLERLLKTN